MLSTPLSSFENKTESRKKKWNCKESDGKADDNDDDEEATPIELMIKPLTCAICEYRLLFLFFLIQLCGIFRRKKKRKEKVKKICHMNDEENA